MLHLSIDIETYSSVNLPKEGLYNYAEASDFQLLLFAWSADFGPVQVVDLACAECIPDIVQQALFDSSVIKHAYNAPFEWYCLSRHYNVSEPQTWLPQWQDTMLHGLYCGYTAGLAATGEALGLPADKLKSRTGSALIRTFCIPCKPTKSNGQRIRNLPGHEPEKWELFKEYNRQDVVTEIEIEKRLSAFPVPGEIQEQWIQDQCINLRGVAVDMDLVNAALSLDEKNRRRNLDEAMELSGLSNPNSRSQLKKWLEEETGEELEDVRKETVSHLLTITDDRKVRRMLTLRQELSKTSIKKYTAMQTLLGGATACAVHCSSTGPIALGAGRGGTFSLKISPGRICQCSTLHATW